MTIGVRSHLTKQGKQIELVVDLNNLNGKDTHAGLCLDKYLLYQEKKGDTTISDKENSRAILISKVASLPAPAVYTAFYQEWMAKLELYQAQQRIAQTRGRMIIGLGIESVLETSIALHPTYGVPYIPGSALKGLAASYLREQFGSKWRDDPIKLQQYNVIFGDNDDAGYITFFDALPIPSTKQQEWALHQDIITVHHPDYYSGKKKASNKNTIIKNPAPTDLDNPNPVPFLSATGKYLIALAAPDLQEAQLWINATFDILGNALQHRGIGAKTSSGYGRMELIIEDESGVTAAQHHRIEISPEAQQCIAQIQAMPKTAINQGIEQFFKQWKFFSDKKDLLMIARAIVQRIEDTEYTHKKADKNWYKELVGYIQAMEGNI